MIFWFAGLAFLLCFVAVPPVIAISWRIGAVDRPIDWRRMHRESLTRGGGLAIFGAFLVAYLVWGGGSRFASCAVTGGFLMLTVGLWDDILGMPALLKLFFQSIIATAAVLGSESVIGLRALPAIFWVVMLTNAHNFIDGLDGLLAGSAVLECAGLCLAFLWGGLRDFAIPPLLLGASCLAFRRYNRYPAELFAGDCGSGSVGFLLGMFSLPLLQAMTVTPSALTPFFLFAYPIADLLASVMRRILRGRSPFGADRGHLHHRISAVGLPHPQCTRILLWISAGLSCIGALLSAERFAIWAAFACVGVVLLLVGIRRFILNFS